MKSLRQTYGEAVAVDLKSVPLTRPLNHTMYDALDRYVAKKVPTRFINEVLSEGGRLYILAAFPDDADTLLEELGFSDLRHLRWEHEATTKSWNRIRPSFYVGTIASTRERVLLCCVVPGFDYLLHYASLVRHYAITRDIDADVAVFNFPAAEVEIELWSHMPTDLIQPGDVVILGYVDELAELLGVEPPREHAAGGYFGVSRVEMRGNRPAVSFVGVAFSYWGSISYQLVARLCRQGASEIIYSAKLGALTSMADLYSRIFVPDAFVLLEHTADKGRAEPCPQNGILEFQPQISTGLHVSVPSVLEEDYAQRALTARLGANSIDNEISQMALAVSDHNHSNHGHTRFSAVHFATDYLRQANEKILETGHDLAKEKIEARAARDQVLRKIAGEVLGPYLKLVPEAG